LLTPARSAICSRSSPRILRQEELAGGVQVVTTSEPLRPALDPGTELRAAGRDY